jgi:hypothetical protein
MPSQAERASVLENDLPVVRAALNSKKRPEEAGPVPFNRPKVKS